jgi:hypothetical protein
MDPYLEHPSEWPGVHDSLIALMRLALADAVGPEFFVGSETAVYIVTPDDIGRDYVRPDLFLVEVAARDRPAPAPGVIKPPVLVRPQFPIEIRQSYLEIRDRAGRRVVTTIDLLSPVNKAPNSTGQEEFRRQRNRVMASRTNWIEIDLLRAGERPEDLRPIPIGDYYALLKRAERVVEYELWPFSLRDRLPTIAVPLLPPLPDVPLDLQAALDTLHERFHYADWLDYRQSPPPPGLTAADARWVAERVAAWLAEHGDQARRR